MGNTPSKQMILNGVILWSSTSNPVNGYHCINNDCIPTIQYSYPEHLSDTKTPIRKLLADKSEYLHGKKIVQPHEGIYNSELTVYNPDSEYPYERYNKYTQKLISKYKGGWDAEYGKRSGQGTMIFINHDEYKRYDGQFLDNNFYVHGIMEFQNGEKYVGNWRAGKRTFGTLFNEDGAVICDECEWKNGEPATGNLGDVCYPGGNQSVCKGKAECYTQWNWARWFCVEKIDWGDQCNDWGYKYCKNGYNISCRGRCLRDYGSVPQGGECRDTSECQSTIGYHQTKRCSNHKCIMIDLIYGVK